jgi:hypothetical protein
VIWKLEEHIITISQIKVRLSNTNQLEIKVKLNHQGNIPQGLLLRLHISNILLNYLKLFLTHPK